MNLGACLPVLDTHELQAQTADPLPSHHVLEAVERRWIGHDATAVSLSYQGACKKGRNVMVLAQTSPVDCSYRTR